MKRRLFNVAAVLSLLWSLAAVAAWAMSHWRPAGWRLIATAHSGDLTRVSGGRDTLLFTTTRDWKESLPGFWDAWWALSERGRLNLLAQVLDYQGTLRQVRASPPSLIVDLPGQARAQVVVFGPATGSVPGSSRLGFAAHSDAQTVEGSNGPISARAWVVTLPYWFIALLGLPVPMLWMRARRRRRDARVP